MKKVFGQTVRDIKREVNKKVLKVPPIERKVLDATSNEPWGPHGSHLADIAQASRNYHEYQMLMAVIWKRINDTGKNWRHVYKGLTVLEYLVAHGSERAIDEIREHTYQISALFDFQYVDSSGRDQGSNVRRKSQSLLALVNDKEQIQEVREKAAANRDKYSNTSTGDRPGSQSNAGGYGDKYDEDRYGSRDDGRNDYGREREWGSRNDDRYGRYGDSYGLDGDRYSRDNEERYGQDGYRDDDHRGRSQNSDYQNVLQSRSTDRNGNHTYEDDRQSSSRGSNAKGDSQEGSMASRHLDRKYSDQSLGAPPSYEEIAGTARSPTLSERDGDLSAVPKASSPPASVNPSHETTDASHSAPALPPAPDNNGEVDGFDEFDPRGSFSAISNGTIPTTSGGAEMDLLGSFSEPSSSNSLALVSAAPGTAAKEASAPPNSSSIPTFMPTSSPFTVFNQSFDDPFGDGPFKAIPSMESVPSQQQIPTSTHSFAQNPYQSYDLPQPVIKNAENDFGGSFHGATYSSSGPSGAQLPSTEIPQFQQQELSNNDEDIDILADILPPSGASHHYHSQIDYPVPANQPVSQTGFPHQTNQHESHPGPLSIQSQTALQTGFHAQNSELTSLTALSGQPGQSPLQTSHLPSGASPHVNPQADYPVPTNQQVSQTGFPPQTNQPESQLGQLSLQNQTATQTGFHAQNSELASLADFPGQLSQPPIQTSYPHQQGQSVSQTDFLAQTNQSPALTFPSQTSQTSQMGPTHSSQAAGFPSQMSSSQAAFHAPFRGQSSQPNANFYAGYNLPAGSTGAAAFQTVPQVPTGPVPQNNFLPQPGYNAPVASQMGFQAPQVRPISPIASQSASPASTGSPTIVPQPSKDKFETKSTVWADTLSRGLVNLNISGPKTNPLADIGVDFDAINRKEKRMEKPNASTVTSNITMGKAMGSGSGIGRAGAGALRSLPNAVVGSGMGMTMTSDPGSGFGMGGYSGVNQPIGMGMNRPGNLGMGMNMNMNMNMGQGYNMQQQPGLPPGSTMSGGYNPMMGTGNYAQQPYGGGYR
ncbi:clathrin interactor EPSIN 3-like isoform X2 [Olea europaea var. sylvestris]|uniref:clathrin interactor EPSIN 3-like isoform X2 n=1 Tax=Olea europaea var. sylvestris TaxID=158386 RepID=UPI000C1CFC95|nr:clathrin interactor EPSIN 3-like isoform X2 [Olea europaea var. sylvestris]